MDEMHYQLDLLTAMNEKLLGNDKMFRMICGTSSNAFLYFDYNENHFETLGCWEQFFDFSIVSTNDFLKILDSVEEKYRQKVEAALFCEKTRKTEMTVECVLEKNQKWIEIEVSITYDSLMQPSEKTVRFRDITKNKLQNEELRYMAYYDSLTGLYNRNYFVRILSEWVRNAQEDHSFIEVLCIKLVDFKKVYEAKGMLAGDELVQLFGFYLKEFECEDCIVSHFNDETYYLAIYNSFQNKNAEFYFEELKKKLKTPFQFSDGTEVKSFISVGVSSYPESAKNSLELINCAELAISVSLNEQKNQIRYFEEPILSGILQNINLENELKNAIDNKRFQLYYQPQFDAVSKKLRGAEALIRWQDDYGRFISPSVFIPVAEHDGLIVEIGNWVIEQALRDYSRWVKEYKTQITMSINISPVQYKKKDFVHRLLNLIDKYEIDPHNLELEITESIFIEDFTPVVEKIKTLKEYGIKISLDDFGTGYSSLSYLKDLPIDTLKIDKSFIDTVIFDSPTKVITESIIAMVKKLGCETVAEGVETQEQYEYLKSVQCDNIQGYLLGKPMPSKSIEALLELDC